MFHEDTPRLSSLKISSHDPLDKLTTRQHCPKCNASRKYFCYDCFLPLGDVPVPKLELPIICDILYYAGELKSKSTAVHAKILAPDHVNFIEYPENLPDWNPEETVLLYPSPDAVSAKDLDFSKIKRVVFVDSQWHATHRILRDERVQELKHVKIMNYKTFFWRWQHEGEDCLATIEAIYYFYKEYQEGLKKKYDGEYDDLLYYFAFFHKMIQDRCIKEGRSHNRIKNFV